MGLCLSSSSSSPSPIGHEEYKQAPSHSSTLNHDRPFTSDPPPPAPDEDYELIDTSKFSLAQIRSGNTILQQKK
jgi:hypothetical protein